MLQMIHAENLPEIPSEYIEPYLQRWLMMELESLSFGLTPPEQIKESMKWMSRFAARFCGIHARIAASNEEYKISRLSNEELIRISKEVFD